MSAKRRVTIFKDGPNHDAMDTESEEYSDSVTLKELVDFHLVSKGQQAKEVLVGSVLENNIAWSLGCGYTVDANEPFYKQIMELQNNVETPSQTKQNNSIVFIRYN